MRKKIHLFTFTALICLSLVLAACASLDPGNIPPGKEGMASLDKPFQLHYDEALLLPDENIWVRFASVKDDNRCPKDVTCVQAGEANIILAVAIGDEDASLIELSSTLERSSTVIGGYRVLLQAVEPLPPSAGQLKQEEYVVTVVISLNK